MRCVGDGGSAPSEHVLFSPRAVLSFSGSKAPNNCGISGIMVKGVALWTVQVSRC